MVLASGANRVHEPALAEQLGEPVEKADADFVRQQTGFSIGGVPPLGHTHPLQTFIDRDLFQFDEVWAAAGTPHAVFCLHPDDLLKMGQARVINIV
jgi:prolyl-tRNA editing enzyme YbaK/EbsC (Cys-tRNA(Pro) deacylase)